MGLYQRLLQTVSGQALLGSETSSDHDASSSPSRHQRKPHRPGKLDRDKSRSGRRDRLLRTPLVFETLEPRVLLSGDPITLAVQNALVAGLQSFESWTANNLIHTAQLAQQLPVVSTSVGDLVDLPAQMQTHLVQPAQAYFAAAASTSTFEGLAAALNADPAEAGTVLGQFAHGEYLFTLSHFQTSTPITAALNLTRGQRRDQPACRYAADTVRQRNRVDGADLRLRHRDLDAARRQASSSSRPRSPRASAWRRPNFNAAATLGAADATVTGGAASLSATATVQLKDPLVRRYQQLHYAGRTHRRAADVPGLDQPVRHGAA